MLFAPWQHIYDWNCTLCGQCCRAYSVVLNFSEWLKIVKNYGMDKTVSGLNKLYIKRKNEGSCIFLQNFSNISLCRLQYMKPKACKLWPFKILSRPEYGYVNEAAYNYGGSKLFIYADSTCRGLRYGKPSFDFAANTLREFIEIALDLRRDQYKTTAYINFQF